MRIRTVFCIVFTILMLIVGCSAQVDNTFDDDSLLVGAGFRNTIIYYLSDEGFIVPVMRKIPWEEGIGKATLGYLIAGGANSSELSHQGLNAVIPEGTEISLRIDESGLATANLTNFTQFESMEAENAMIVAVVNTLKEFPSINTVSITVDGNGGKLKNGTILPENCGYINVNLEDVDAETMTSDGVNVFSVYMPNTSGYLMIPLTMYSTAENSFYGAMKLMCEGSKNAFIRQCIPTGTNLIDATIDGTSATVNFTSEFANISNIEGLSEVCYKAIYMTALEYGQIGELKILVDGKPFDMGEVTNPIFANEF